MIIPRRLRKMLKPAKTKLVDWWWQWRGAAIKNPPIPTVVSSITFICMGNICRSAFSHYLMRKLIKSCGNHGNIRVASAGLNAHSGTSSPITAVDAAKELGIRLDEHRSVLLTKDIADRSDMMIAMEPNQVIEMIKTYPHREQNIFLMPLFEERWNQKYSGWLRYHIADPFGKEREEFLFCFERLSNCVKGIMNSVIAD